MTRQQSLRFAAALAAAATVTTMWISLGAAFPGDPAGRAQEAPLRVDGSPPAWLAPGAPLTFSGWAGPGAEVRLLARGRVIGRARAGRLGRFVVRARAPRRSGRYVLALASLERRRALGRLLVRPLVLAAVGDVNLGDRTAAAIASHGSGYPWSGTAPLLRAADLAIGNLECAVSTGGAPVPGKEYTFRGAPRALSAAARAGIDVLSLANNHSGDYGSGALLDTIRHARRAGIATVGGGAELGAARRAVRLELGGLRVAVLAYSDVRPLGFDAGSGRPGAAPAFAELMDPDIRRARRSADVVIVYFHWGDELSTSPSSRQKALADVAFRAGATIVLGAHPHVLQPVQRGGGRLVAWSLGNFVFAASSPGTTRTGILLAHLGASGVVGARLVPATIHGVRPALAPHVARRWR